jgi:asparagine synthase (glutamine-hydrolysing)
MCGIAGLFDPTLPSEDIRIRLRRMTDTIIHRGPDDAGYYFQGYGGLGMRRLSIIDLSTGNQPIHSEDFTIQLVFNGEIYNYLQLKLELEKRGHVFYTHSDTEVIVHAYEEYGESFLLKLRGMFAIALWDNRREILLLAVDRLGVKPLYYAAERQRILFGSELQSLLVSELITREIDYESFAQYLTLGYISAPATIFHSARKLLPGCLLRWNSSAGISIESYWNWKTEQIDYRRSLQETRRQLRQVLGDAVRSHLISDVPLGAFLSGGMDSSTVVALMSETCAGTIKTFSIGFADHEHNELKKARLIAKRFYTDHHEFVVEPEAIDVLPNLIEHFGEPFADPSALPTYYLSKMARRFVKVALSGDGGDELFLGYTIFRGLELARYAQSIPAIGRRMIATLTRALPHAPNPMLNDHIARWRKRITDSMLSPDEAYCSKITVLNESRVGQLLSHDMQARLNQINPYRAVNNLINSPDFSNEAHPLDRFIYAIIKGSLPNDMLTKVDRMSMANSLEVRVPLLDNVLLGFLSTIPIRQRFPGLRLKGLLKDAMADTLPAEILNQHKHGFSVPLERWFRGDLVGYAEDVLLDLSVRQSGFWTPNAIQILLNEHRAGTYNHALAIWTLLVFQLWHTRFLG